MKKILCAFAATLALAAGTAQAGLISTDFQIAGDGLLTLDSTTGLEWLDMTQTLNQSYNSVVAGFGGYTTTHGFRYATQAEVGTLFADAGLSVLGGYVAGNVLPGQALVALIGTGSSVYMDAIIAEGDGFTHKVAIIQGTPDLPNANLTFACTGCGDWNNGDTHATIGSFLVRDSAPIEYVPEPASVLLAGLALVGVAATRRKQAA